MVGVDRSHGVGRELYFFFFGEGWNRGVSWKLIVCMEVGWVSDGLDVHFA